MWEAVSVEKKIYFIINILFYGLIICLALIFCNYILPALLPFLIAFILAAMIQIPAKKIAGYSKKGRKICAIFLCFLCYFIFFTGVMLLGIKLIKEAGELMTSAAEFYTETLEPFLDDVSNRIEVTAATVDKNLAQKVEEIFQGILDNMGQYISDFSVKIVKWISEGAKGIPSGIVKLVITVVATFFMAVDFDKMIALVKKIVPADRITTVEKGVNYVKHILAIYLKSYSLLFLITFVELGIGLFILRIPYAFAVALAISIFDILPVLGTGGILLPWAVILLLMREVPLAVGILILYIVITVIRNIVEPKLVGKQIGLHPIATLAAMFVGLKILGFVGMIGFPVTLAIVVNLKKKGILFHK